MSCWRKSWKPRTGLVACDRSPAAWGNCARFVTLLASHATAADWADRRISGDCGSGWVRNARRAVVALAESAAAAHGPDCLAPRRPSRLGLDDAAQEHRPHSHQTQSHYTGLPA